ncbi:Protein of unknown function DUF2921 [Dillenia turbinata]|uniref:RING-type E3 ubiquitin transferase n=1 Tax=Dillenia turbinata TaxID=194707 RepID=A0AAN8WII5_9MAGN
MGFSSSFSIISKTCLFLLILFASSASSSPSKDLYDDHCNSMVPKATPTKIDFTDFPLTPFDGNIYYKGGDKIFKQESTEHPYQYPKALTIKPTGNVYQTDVSGVFKFEASLIFRSTVFYSSSSNDPNSKNKGNVAFKLHGFWSDSSGKLCMVGTGSGYSEEGKLLNLEAVLKLNYVKKSNIYTSLVDGTLESLKLENDENYFDPISILTFPSMKSYYYTFASEKSGHSVCASGGLDVLKDSLRGLTTSGDGVCSMFFRWPQTFQLDYADECKNSKGNCNPLGGIAESVPQYMSTQVIQCSEDKQRLRVLLYFSNGSYGAYDRLFDPNTTLVGEGLWDGEKNQLCVVACRILAPEGSLGNASVGNCYYRLSFRFPAKLSIRETSFIQGQIWSNKKVGDSGYFDKIKYRSHDRSFYGVETSELKYEYTEMERIKKLCPPNKEVKKKGSSYPEPLSYQMSVSMSIESSKVKNMWGNAVPLFVGNNFYEQGSHSVIANLETSAAIQNGRLKISYKIRLSLPLGTDLGGGLSAPSSSSEIYPESLISAEGIYDIETGDLCMVGCRELNSSMQISSNQTMDCEIVFKLKFPPSNSRRASDITGTMQSSRRKSDPLYFEELKISSNAYRMYESQRSIWRMDMEIAMVLISNTLAFVFVALQIFYARKNRESLPYISLVMLMFLALGHLIPLVLNFEALFMKHGYHRRFGFEREGWLQLNEVILRVVTMIALFLLLRLLQLTWTARSTDPNQKGLWGADKKAFYVCLPLYLAGGVIVLMVHSIRNHYGTAEGSSSRVIGYHHAQHSLWDDLKSYAGLVLDGFLLPQILLNMFFNSKEAALSRFFYMGTTAVRLLPHCYDLYRAYKYVNWYDGSYYFADHGADYYSTAWDIIIPCGGLVFAIFIFLQQKFGGRCVLPRKFREYQEYEKVPVVSEG